MPVFLQQLTPLSEKPPHAVSCSKLEVLLGSLPLILSWILVDRGGLYTVPQQMLPFHFFFHRKLPFREQCGRMKTVSVYYCDELSLKRGPCWPTRRGKTSKLNKSTNGHEPSSHFSPLLPHLCTDCLSHNIISACWRWARISLRGFQQVSFSYSLLWFNF